MSILSENLKKCRHYLELTQEKAAKELGIKRALLGAWEEGRSKPTLPIFPKLTAVYQIIDWETFILSPHFDPAHQTPSTMATSLTEQKYRKLSKKLKELADNC